MSASVFPARAGMSRTLFLLRLRAARVPRASGDEPASEAAGNGGLACSPRERG